MSTAQAQADFMASTGTMTHSGPGGSGLTERLLAAGYPLAGDLSLGGFRAENITGGNEDMPVEAAVDRWTGDAPHLNTMVSPNLTEIGAGVAISNGRVYYVIDAARPTTAGAPPTVATSIVSGAPVPEAVPDVIIPVSVSTPNAEGSVFHDVKFGQTLWQIAITYEVKIDDIKRLNNLLDNNIYPGSTLLIKQEVIISTSLPTEAMTEAATSTSLPTMTVTAQPVRSTPGAEVQSISTDNTTLLNVMIGIIALAVVGGGIVAWIGSARSKRTPNS
jgi:LysM repeat protein